MIEPHQLGGIPRLYLAACELAVDTGARDLGTRPPWRYATATGLELLLNGADAEQESIPAYTLVLRRKGWPLAVVDPGGGCVVRAPGMSEDGLLDELGAELRRLREGGLPTPPVAKPEPPPPRPAPATAPARCMRCGEKYDCELDSMYLPELCHPCYSFVTRDLGSPEGTRRFHRLVDRYRRGQERHPTYRLLQEHQKAPAQRPDAEKFEPPF